MDRGECRSLLRAFAAHAREIDLDCLLPGQVAAPAQEDEGPGGGQTAGRARRTQRKAQKSRHRGRRERQNDQGLLFFFVCLSRICYRINRNLTCLEF